MAGVTHVRRSDGEPHDDLTRLCDAMTLGLPAGVKAIILLDEGDAAGMVAHGYDEDAEVSEALARHHRAWRIHQQQKQEGEPT